MIKIIIMDDHQGNLRPSCWFWRHDQPRDSHKIIFISSYNRELSV